MFTTLPATRRFTVDDYYRMAEAGILSEDDRVELLDGQVVPMSPMGRRHIGSVNRLANWLKEQLGKSVVVQVQLPLLLDQYSEPEPDIAVLKPRQDYYGDTKARPEDVLLLIEVADTSLDKDCQVKVPLYAKYGVSEVWVVDIPYDAIHVYREPAVDGYQKVQRLRIGDTISPAAFPDVSFTVASIFGQ